MLARLTDDTGGSAAAEFAVVLPLLALLTVGMLGLVSQTVNRARLDRAAATGAMAYVQAAHAAGGAEQMPGGLPRSANGIGLCAALTDHTGSELERLSGCSAPLNISPPLSAVDGEAILTVWVEGPVGVRPFRMMARAVWRAAVPR